MSKVVGVVSHHEREVDELRADREFAVEYLKAALASLANPEERAGALSALRALAEAYGGLAAIAAQTGLSRESLYRSLSPKGNPTLKTLVAVVNTMGLRLSVVEERHGARKRSKSRTTRKAA